MTRLRVLARASWPLLLYLAVGVYITWEVWRFKLALLGGGDEPDWTGTLWTYWWTSHALVHGLNPAHGTLDFYPVGISPVAQYNLLDAVLASPFILLLGPVRGYNLFGLLALVGTALSMHRLARVAGAGPLAAAVAGLTLECSTFLGYEISEGRLSQVLLAPMLLAMSGLYQLSLGGARRRTAVGTGLLVATTFLGYWYYGLFLLFGAAALWLAELRALDGRRLRQLALAAAITVALCAPFVLALVHAYAQLPGVQRPMEAEGFDYGAYGRGEFSLNMAINQSLWPGWPVMTFGGSHEDHRVPLVTLALALVGVLIRGRRLRWLGVALVGWVLSAGPYLRDMMGNPRPYKLPYLFLYDHLPMFSRLWWPNRLAVLVWIGLAVLAALGLEAMLSWARGRGRAFTPILAALVGLALAWDARHRNTYLPPDARPGRPVAMQIYKHLEGAIITVPVLGHDPSSRHLLWFQVFHGQPILSGLGAHLTAHRPPGYEDYIRNNGLLNALRAASEGEAGGQTITPYDVSSLRRDGFVWAVVEPMAMSAISRGEQSRNFNQIFTALWGKADLVSGPTNAWRVSPLIGTVKLPDRPATSWSYTGQHSTSPTQAAGPRGDSKVRDGKRQQGGAGDGPGALGEGQQDARDGGAQDLDDAPGE